MNIFVDSADFSVGMALLDMVPVILFFVAGIFLLKDMYNKLVKGNYALLATGTIMIFFAGLFKAIYKSLVALNVCAWEALNLAFFPMQATGFLLLGGAMLGVFYSQKENKEKEVFHLPYFSFACRYRRFLLPSANKTFSGKKSGGKRQ